MVQLVLNGWQIFSFTGGDFASLLSLFFDNLSTLLAVTSALAGYALGSGAPALAREIVFKRMMPGLVIMLFFGNAYYSFQCARMSKKYGRQFVAQPYGLNTTGAFPFIAFMNLIATGKHCLTANMNCQANPGPCVEKAYQVGLAANFLVGIINIVLGVAGDQILRMLPIAAVLTPLAGIAIVWLSVNQILPNFGCPAVGLLPVWLVIWGYYSQYRLRVKGIPMPEVLPLVVVGIIGGWAYGKPVADGDLVRKAWDNLEGAGIYWGLGDCFDGFEGMKDAIGMVLPIALIASFNDVMCLVSAQKAGDPYPIRETMISDGIGTMIGAILGSPVGTCVYLGHPVHKMNGATNGYSSVNGLIYLVIGFCGLYELIYELIPDVAVGPIIMIFGLQITEEAFKFTPARHYCAIIFGLFFFFFNLSVPGGGAHTVNASAQGDTMFFMYRYDYTNYTTDPATSGIGNAYDTAASTWNALSLDQREAQEWNYWAGNWYAKMAMGGNPDATLISMIWCAIISYTVDRLWIKASAWCVGAAVLSGCGIIHQNEAFKGFWKGVFSGTDCAGNAIPDGYSLTAPGKFMIGYLCIAVWCWLSILLNRLDPESFPDAIPQTEGEYDNLGKHWWDNAATGKVADDGAADADGEIVVVKEVLREEVEI